MAVGARHNPDRELFGQGLANIATSLFGGVPATGAIARTAVNVRSGARTRLAALTHAVILAAIVYLAAGFVAQIPLAALAGVLLATTVRMVETASILAITRAARADTVVMVATFLVTVVFDLVTAVAVGVGFAAILALRAVARSARIEQVPLEPTTTWPRNTTCSVSTSSRTGSAAPCSSPLRTGSCSNSPTSPT